MEVTMTDKVVLVKANQLMKTYPGNVQALDGVNLTIHEGEFLSIMGPSGSGKSTLLNLIGALDQPTSGEVFVAGESVAGIQDLDRFRSRTVGFVFQLHNLLPTLTARENVEIPMFERRLPSSSSTGSRPPTPGRGGPCPQGQSHPCPSFRR